MNLGVDIGGTFTDVIAFDPSSERTLVSKALNQGVGPARGLLDALDSAHVSRNDVTELTHGTTVITNLLIERTGGTVGLLCTRGFRDLLEIQLSYRRLAFALKYEKKPPLIPRDLRREIAGRLDHAGREIEPIDEAEVRTAVEALLACGIESLAIALYNAYANPLHEHQVARIAHAVAPDLPLIESTDVDRRIGEYERVSTAALNAMAVPRMRAYVDDLDHAVRPAIEYMHSAGGLLPATEARDRPIQLAFSGPAAGVLAGREVARQLGYAHAITMDMGGTSCDVCLIWDDELRYRSSFDVEWGIPARVQAVDVHTVGAGGGSICWRDSGGALRVGPLSAGATPGPVCYGRGGSAPTVTDANLALGILSPAGLLGGRLPLDQDGALAALTQLGREFGTDPIETARGAYAIVSANMAGAIREITVRKGIDPRACVLIAFGGAGPQHAAAVARELGIGAVVVPAHGGILSAVGLLTADLRITSARTLLMPVQELDSSEVSTAFAELELDARARMHASDDNEVLVERFAGLRYEGQSHEVEVPVKGDSSDVLMSFEAEHEKLFGTRLGDAVEVVDCWVTATKPRATPAALWSATPAAHVQEFALESRHLALVGRAIPVFMRGRLGGAQMGPCLVEETHSVTVVPVGASVRERNNHLVIELRP